MVWSGNCSTPWVFLEVKLNEYALGTSISALILTGAARSMIFVAERRGKRLQRRLTTSAEMRVDGTLDSSPALRKTLPAHSKIYFFPSGISDRLNTALAATGNRLAGPHLILAGLAAAAVAGGIALSALQVPVSVATMASASAALAGPFLVIRFSQMRYQRHFLERFPDAIDLIVRAVRAGLPALEAMDLASREIAAPVGTEFRQTLNDMHIGIGMEDALQRTANRVRVQEFRFFVVCLVLQRRTGGGLADALSSLSALIRHRRAVYSKARALSAETKASAVVVALMPLVAGIGLSLINRSLMSSLFLDPRGRFMLGVAITSLSIGILIMIVILRKGPR
jgi:tight adherence protein B